MLSMKKENAYHEVAARITKNEESLHTLGRKVGRYDRSSIELGHKEVISKPWVTDRTMRMK